MFTSAFVKDAGERAVKAFAGALLSLWVVADNTFNLANVDFGNALGIAGGAAVASLLLSLVSYKAGQTGTASAVKDVTYTGGTNVL